MTLSARDTLRIGYGLLPIVAGADKFTNLLVDWEKYLAPDFERKSPVSGRAFMRFVGVVEMAAGALVLSRWTRLGAWVVAGWLSGITLNLLFSRHYYDVAARDALLALGAVALGQLSREEAVKRAQPAIERQSTVLGQHAQEAVMRH